MPLEMRKVQPKVGGLSAYLINMAVRLLAMRRVLAPTGSIYLHCDDTASHYLKMVMDAIFGQQNYRAEVIWKRNSSELRGSEQLTAGGQWVETLHPPGAE